MKKICIFIILAVLAATLVGCGSQDVPEPTTAPVTEPTTLVEIAPATEPTAEPEFNIGLPEIPEDEDVLLEIYQQVVRERLAGNEKFISDEESEIYHHLGYHLRNQDGLLTKYDYLWGEEHRYYYPVLFSREGEVVLVYTSQHGQMYTETEDRYSAYAADAHGPGEGENITSYSNYKLEYDTTTGEIRKWSFGELVETYQVPGGAIYCGRSFWEGYIFRHKSDVYALTTPGEASHLWDVLPIAHGVKEVIVSDYDLSSDAWSQPLFLMEDGTIKAYLGWEADELGSDHPDLLVEVQDEGGYYKTSPDPR